MMMVNNISAGHSVEYNNTQKHQTM